MVINDFFHLPIFLEQQKRGSILLGIDSLKINLDSLKIKQLDVMDDISEEGDITDAGTKSPGQGSQQRRQKSLKRRFLDNLQEAILPSKSVVLNVQRLFASNQALNAERERHLRVNRYAIHPMSKLRYVHLQSPSV